MNDESRRMWKEVVVDLLEILCRHLSQGTKENHETFSQYSWCHRAQGTH
jgi:hypothetical protein